jgi:hypothetical protein
LINLRYHIVSITAVFLALGIGLTLGTSFLDRVTVDTLKQQLDDVEQRVAETDARNSELAAQVERFEERDAALAAGISRVVEDQLGEVPVLVIATEGTDQAQVDQAVATLGSSGAEVAGTWWLTERWELDDEDEVQALSDALAITSEDPERLFSAGTARLGQVLADAAVPVEEAEELAEEAAADPADATAPAAGEPDAPAEPAEPELLAALEAAGFVDYQALPGSGDERVLLPAAGARYVVVSSTDPGAGSQRAASSVVTEMAEDDIVPVLAAQGAVDLQQEDGTQADEDQRRTTFVGPLREADGVREHISTIDNLDTATGLVTMVLALDDLGDSVVGHYGVATGAAGLVPGTPSP